MNIVIFSRLHEKMLNRRPLGPVPFVMNVPERQQPLSNVFGQTNKGKENL